MGESFKAFSKTLRGRIPRKCATKLASENLLDSELIAKLSDYSLIYYWGKYL
jgi:hypothetical protein